MTTRIEKKWQILPTIPADIDAKLTDFSPLARQVLFNRGIYDSSQASAFLSAACLTATDPFKLLGMDAAVKRICQAIDNNQVIAIYGDYDVDGVAATVLLVECLRRVGGIVREYIPNRFEEGYGVNSEALGELKRQGVDLVITVDCGARSPREADYAHSIGLDLIITDHHQPGDVLPHVIALLNPKQLGDSYPDQNLAGVGLAFKLAEAMKRFYPAIQLEEYLDLVALGTVADMATLVGENRYLVKCGLDRIHGRFRQGILSLAGTARIDVSKVTAMNISFMLGPRLNAAGRLESALDAFNLLITTDIQEAGCLAQLLDNRNRERRAIMEQMQEDATRLAFENNPNPWVLFAYSTGFNEGVIGLAASRLTERYYRPAVIGSIKGETARFSCRSIPEIHITCILDQMADLFIRHGGHAAAAGLTIHKECIPEFMERMNSIVKSELLGLDLSPVLLVDKEVNLAELNPRDYFELADRLEPTGMGNPEVVLLSRHVKCRRASQIGKDKTTLRMNIMQGGVTYDAVAFGQGHRFSELSDFIDLVYTLGQDTYLGKDRPRTQLLVKDVRPSC